MSFELVIDDEAVKFLEKLERPLAQRIFQKIQAAKDNPFRFFEHLEGRNDFKLRVGDYRVIADICCEKRIIEITKIGHRKNIYKNA